MKCKTCGKKIHPFETYGSFYYCHHCEKTFSNELSDVIKNERIEKCQVCGCEVKVSGTKQEKVTCSQCY